MWKVEVNRSIKAHCNSSMFFTSPVPQTCLQSLVLLQRTKQSLQRPQFCLLHLTFFCCYAFVYSASINPGDSGMEGRIHSAILQFWLWVQLTSGDQECHLKWDRLQNADEHTWLLPTEITLIALVCSSFELIWAPAIIIILVWPLLWCCDCLFNTKNYQSMLNWHFAVMTRIASRNYFVHKSALYWHSLSILEASDFNCSIFPQVLPVSPRKKQPSLMTKASQGQSLELLWQSVAFKLSYSKVLGAIVAPSFLGLFSHTINWNS